MALAQLLDRNADADVICATCSRWTISLELAVKVYLLARALPFPVSIISGHRTAEEQRALANQGATAAPVDLSNHTSCPATAVDLRPSVPVITDEVKRAIGRAAERVGLRWGGGAQRIDGIPVGNEWRHVDLGPRRG